MIELSEQAPAAPTAHLLHATEIEFCRLRAQREAIEIRLDETGLKDSSQRSHLQAEFRSLDEQMAHVQIEQLQHRVALLKAQLPEDKEALPPVQSEFEQAQQRYLASARGRERAAAALHQAKMKVSCAEANISFYERTIRELKQKLASKGNPERSAGEIASELSSLEKRLRQLKTTVGN